tara:strand:- start:252 stop:551 length:300 start_codon:yes stop_codon:yes gene_type:complete
MHPQVNDSDKDIEKSALLQQRDSIMQNYRQAVVWACRVLEYKRKFDREEDYGDDGLQDFINALKEDARRELRDTATNIKVMQSKIRKINEELIGRAGEK